MPNNQLPDYLREIDQNATGKPRGSSPKHNISFSKTKTCIPSSVFVLCAAVISALGGVLFGYDVGIVSGALLQLKNVYCLSCFEREMVVSSMLAGAVIASLTGGFLVDFIGRRSTIIVNAVIFAVGAIILCAAQSYLVLIVGRLILGFAVALSVIAECVYISEISPPKRRGFLVSLNEMGIVVGFLVAYLVDFAFIEVTNGWRYMFGLSVIPAVIQGIAMCFLPPSPRYLLLKDKTDEAKQVLDYIYNSSAVEFELEKIKKAIAEEKAHSTLDLCRSKDNMWYRCVIGMGLVFLQQFTGQPTVLYYAPTIFQSIGFLSNTAATLATVGLGVSKVFACGVALLLLDRVGGRNCLLIGTVLMTISIGSLGVVTLNGNTGQFQNPCVPLQSSHCLIQTSHNLTTQESQFIVRKRSLVRVGDLNGNNGIYGKDIVKKWIDIDGGLLAERNEYIPTVGSSRMKRDRANDTNEAGLTNSTTTGSQGLSGAGKWIALTSLICFVGSYEVGFGAGTWLILSEIFPSAIRGRAFAFALVFNWGTNLLISFTFLDFMNAVGISWTFIPYAVICALSAVFIFVFVPETKGKTLEEIGQIMKTSNSCLSKLCKRTAGQSESYERMSDLETARLQSADDYHDQ